MKIDIDSLRDKMFMITIYPDRFKFSTSQFNQKLGFSPLEFRGISSYDNFSRNCAMSHAAVIEHAKNLGLPFVFVFEDDAYPCDNTRSRLSEYLSDIPDDASVVSFGTAGPDNGVQDFSKKFNRITSTLWGTHAYIMFAKAYDLFIHLLREDGAIADHVVTDCLSCQSSYITDDPLFIQYTKDWSNSHILGYAYCDMNYGVCNSVPYPPRGFSPVPADHMADINAFTWIKKELKHDT